MSDETRPRLAESYRVHKRGIDIDGEPFPWFVADAPGPLVQKLDEDDVHILWLPVLIEACLPPSTVTLPLDEPTHPTSPSAQSRGEGRGGAVSERGES